MPETSQTPIAQIRAIKALRMNYTRRGVVRWLKGHQGTDTAARNVTGWQRVIREPRRVEREQLAVAEGVCS